ncbi:hypothetical protein ACMDCT_04220 [Halomonadaceae bacterium KBTZ08]
MATDLSGLKEIDGLIGGCLVDSDSGLVLGKQGESNFDLDTAAAGNTEVIRAKRKTMRALKIEGDLSWRLIRVRRRTSAC